MSDVNTLVGRGSHFEGKMTFEGTVRVDGSFVGEIVSDDTLIIGEGAEVRAELDVAKIVIYGTVYGNTHASESVELRGSARVVGNVVTPSLVVERGAVFDGNCRMGALVWPEEGQVEEGEVTEAAEPQPTVEVAPSPAEAEA